MRAITTRRNFQRKCNRRFNLRWTFPCSVAALVWLLSSATTVQAAVSTVAYWRMGENDTGTPFFGGVLLFTNLTDETGNHPLSVRGSVTYSTNVSAAASSATGSTASGEFIGTAYATNGIVSTATDNFGIEGWVNPATTGDGMLFYNGDTGLSGWGVMTMSGNYTGLIGGKQYIVGPAVIAGVWTHVALVCTNGISVLYIQGQPVATGSSTPAAPTAGFALGCTPQTPGAISFTGNLDEVRVFTFATNQFRTNDLLYYQTYNLSTTNVVKAAGAGSGIVILAPTLSGAVWTNTVNASWLHLDAADQSGAGTKLIHFNFDANPGATRVGTLTIAGRTVTVTQAGVTYTQTTQPVTCFNTFTPAGLAVDPSGIVYALSGSTVYKWTPGTAAPVALITSGLNTPQGLALDNANNLYIANFGDNTISKWTAATSTLTTLFTTLSNTHPFNVVVDSAGNAHFHADGLGIVKWSLADGNQTVRLKDDGYDSYSGLAVDAASTVYSLDEFSNPKDPAVSGNIAIELPVNATIPTDITATDKGKGQGIGMAVAVDPEANVYCAYVTPSSMVKWSPGPNSLTGLGGQATSVIAVDVGENYYFASGGVQKIPYAFVDATAQSVPMSGGSGQLPPVLPLNADLAGALSPTTDQSWISITGVTNGVVYYSVAANTNIARSGNIFVLRKAVPVQQVGVPIVPPVLTGTMVSSNGVLQFSFTNNQTTNFSVLYSTNVSLPLSNWILLGAPSNISPGVFQFTTSATNDPQGFYRVRSP